MRWSLLVAGTALVVLAPWLLQWLARRFGQDETPMGTYRYTFEGEDQALRARTEARRRQAAALKREGQQIETKDDRVSRIHRVQ